MPLCVAPICYPTRPMTNNPSFCMKPNSWNIFAMKLGGDGLDNATILARYKKWKLRWQKDHPGLSRSVGRKVMNEHLCAEIATSPPLGLKKTRGRTKAAVSKKAKVVKKESTGSVFFAAREVPVAWSIRTQLAITSFPLQFNIKPALGKSVTESISREGAQRFSPGRWLNSDIVNVYMALLGGRGDPSSTKCLFMSSHFFTKFEDKENVSADHSVKARHDLVKTWSRGVDLMRVSKVFVPVNVSRQHWYLIVIDLDEKTVLSLDSLGKDYRASGFDVDWLQEEHRSKRRGFDRVQWTSMRKVVPGQTNGYDCGVFMCMYAAFLSNDREITFKQSNMPKMRERMAWSVFNSVLS
ncbi:unnamed protein product, partial [Pylaiella littoralis]